MTHVYLPSMLCQATLESKQVFKAHHSGKPDTRALHFDWDVRIQITREEYSGSCLLSIHCILNHLNRAIAFLSSSLLVSLSPDFDYLYGKKRKKKSLFTFMFLLGDAKIISKMERFRVLPKSQAGRSRCFAREEPFIGISEQKGSET